MKKLILIGICTFTMVLLFALNYLLWDRENKINTVYTKDADISDLTKEIKNLNTANDAFLEKIDQLEATIKMLGKNNAKLQEERDYGYRTINQKNNIINYLKPLIDTSSMESTISRWADSLDKGQYQDAYQLQLNQFPGQPYISFEEFANNYKSQIKKIKVKSIKLILEDIPQQKLGDLVFKVSLDIKKVSQQEKSLFEDGVNDKQFTMVYSEDKNIWVIGDIQ